jgi:hypothetical protein
MDINYDYATAVSIRIVVLHPTTSDILKNKQLSIERKLKHTDLQTVT